MTTLADALDGFRPRVLLTLGSGLGQLAEHVNGAWTLDFKVIGLPEPTAPGHRGRFVAGELHGVPVLVQQGRLHLYEGHDALAVTAAVRAAAAAGVETFLVSNAAGGLSENLEAGDILLIRDQLNLTGTSPLVGASFVDMTDAYDPTLRAQAHDAAVEAAEPLVEGVYAGVRGPAFETAAEVGMLRTLGADAVGMSTVCETIAARQAAMRVAGFSVITNVHRPGGTPTSHGEVLAVAAAAGVRLTRIIARLLPRLA